MHNVNRRMVDYNIHDDGLSSLFESFLLFPLYSPLETLKKKLRYYPNVEEGLLDVVCPRLIEAKVFAYNVLGQSKERLVKLLGESDGNAVFNFLHGLCCSFIFYAS